MNQGRGTTRRRRAQTSTVRVSSNFVTPRGLRRELRGVAFNPRNNPRAVSLRPWNSLTLVFFGTASSVITDTSIGTGLLAQLGIATLVTGYQIQFRIQQMRVWIEVGTDSGGVARPLTAPLNVTFHSIIGEGDNTQASDVGGDVSYPSCGYIWPAKDQVTTLLAGGGDKIATIRPVSTTATWITHILLLWSPILTADVVQELDGVSASMGALSL